MLKGKEKTVAYRSFEVANDGARFDESDLKTTWYIDRVEVVVSGSEQRDELVTMRLMGRPVVDVSRPDIEEKIRI